MDNKIITEIGVIVKNVMAGCDEFKSLQDQCENSMRIDVTVHSDVMNMFVQETERTISKENPFKKFKKQQAVSNKSVRAFNDFHGTTKVKYFNDKESFQYAVTATETLMVKKSDLIYRASQRVRTNDDVYREELLKSVFAIVQYSFKENKFTNISYNRSVNGGDIDDVSEEITYHENMTSIFVSLVEYYEKVMGDISKTGILAMKLDTQDGINKYEETKRGIIRKYIGIT